MSTENKIKEAPGYMTYREAALMFSLMPDEEAAQAIKATVNYFLFGTVADLEGVAGKVFEIMRADIDRGNEKYRKICSRNEENGKLGGRPPKKPIPVESDTTGKDFEEKRNAALQKLMGYNHH